MGMLTQQKDKTILKEIITLYIYMFLFFNYSLTYIIALLLPESAEGILPLSKSYY